MSIVIKPVESKGDLRRFINYPYTLYKGNKYWCPPMRMDEWNSLDPKKNPAFDFCEAQYFLAYEGKTVVGRIAAIINRLRRSYSKRLWSGRL